MDCEAVALRVLAHFVPGTKVLDFLAPEADWLNIRWCAGDDSPDSQATFYRELPDADVIWHVLRPLSGADLARGNRLRLVHKFGAGVNTIDVGTATERGIAVANMPGANAPSVSTRHAVRLSTKTLWSMHRRRPVSRGGAGRV
jgi:lactate dehydrogenase-like 2-hydroxyacid dehydrogenase